MDCPRGVLQEFVYRSRIWPCRCFILTFKQDERNGRTETARIKPIVKEQKEENRQVLLLMEFIAV